MPSVRVVIPTFNRAADVCDAVATVQRQTWPDFDVVVVDDGSSDDTIARLEAIAAAEPRLRVVRGSHGGVAAARTLGLNAPGGCRYVAFLDADDRWEPDHLRSAVDVLDREHDVSLVFGAFDTEDGTGTWTASELDTRRRRVRQPIDLAVRQPGPDIHILDPERTVSAMLRGVFCPHTSTTVVRVSSVPPGPWFDAALVILEDVDFFLRLAFTRRAWAFIDVKQCTVRFIGDNLTRSSDLSSPITLARQRASLLLREKKLRHCVRLDDRRHVQLQVAQQAYLVGQCSAEQGDFRSARAAYFRSLQASPSLRAARSLFSSFLPRPIRETLKVLRRPSR